MIDPFNKKIKWATQQIDWLIKKVIQYFILLLHGNAIFLQDKGDTIDTDTARERAFVRRLHPGENNRTWDLIIVISHEDQKSLPTSFLKRELDCHYS